MDPLSSLSPNMVVLPPGYLLSPSDSQCSGSGTNDQQILIDRSHPVFLSGEISVPDDLIAVDVVILPTKEISEFIKQSLNSPLVKACGSFPLDESHFPHQSLLHTFIRASDLAQFCHDLDVICGHKHPQGHTFADNAYLWHTKIEHNQNPCYNGEKEMHPLPYQHSQEYYGVSPPEGITELLTTERSLTSLLNVSDSDVNAIQEAKAIFGTNIDFQYDFISPGPQWEGDTTLPFLAYRNPPRLLDTVSAREGANSSQEQQHQQAQPPNGWFQRMLHEMVTILLSRYLCSIPAARGTEFRDDKDLCNTLDSIAQRIYYTGSGITPHTSSVAFTQGTPLPYLCQSSLSLTAQPSLPNSNHVHEGEHHSHQDQHGGAKTGAEPVSYYKPIPPHSGAEPVDFATFCYTNVFSERYAGNSYNPHITIGSGSPDVINETIQAAVEQTPPLRPPPPASSTTVDTKTPAYPDIYLAKPIPMVMANSTIAVFQLGANGSCRYPVFKTTLKQ